MPSKLSRPLHLPGLPRPTLQGTRSHRSGRTTRVPHHPSSLTPQDLPSQIVAGPGQWVRGWQRRALRESLAATLLTSLLTSSVLAAPELFRQSPAVSWRQFTTPALTVDQQPVAGVLVDCP